MQNARRPMNNSERIEAIRRRRAMRRARVAVVFVLAAAVLFAWFTGLFGAPLSRLGDVVDSVKIALTPGDGWPQAWSISDFMSAQPLGSGCAVLTGKELRLYAENGNQLRSIPHGYARAAITAGNTRVCLYNRSGTQLQVESRTRNLFSMDTDDPILLAQMSPNGTLAVATQTTVTVYSPLFEQIWQWTGATETTTGLAFASDNRHFAVATLYASEGAVGTKLHFFSTSESEESCVVLVPEGIPIRMQYLSRSRLLVVYDTCAAVYNVANGEETSHYDYGTRILQGADVSDTGEAVLLFGGAHYTDIGQLVVLDTGLSETASLQTDARAWQVKSGHNMAYLLTDSSVVTYAWDGTLRGTTTLDAKPLGAVCTMNGTLLFTADGVCSFTAPRDGATQTLHVLQEDVSSASQSSLAVPSSFAASSVSNSMQQAASPAAAFLPSIEVFWPA